MYNKLKITTAFQGLYSVTMGVSKLFAVKILQLLFNILNIQLSIANKYKIHLNIGNQMIENGLNYVTA